MKLHRFSISLIALTLGLSSCSDWLEQEPLSQITPDGFVDDADKVRASIDAIYTDIMPTHSGWTAGIYGFDNNTDNQMSNIPDNKFGTGLWLVSSTNDAWSWRNLRNVNYWLEKALSGYSTKTIKGDEVALKQYIGELYFLRAYVYFDLRQKFGDLPIFTSTLPDDEGALVAVADRRPCNEVSRFVINTLDTAMTYLKKDGFSARHTRISYDAAMLLKSRVALYEASWLRYFDGTPFVPNGEGWPGATKEYNKNYKYPTGSAAKESEYFYGVAADASEYVAEKYKGMLVTNTGTIPQSTTDPDNPYFSLWGTTDMSGTPEILLWREYNHSLGVVNMVESSVQEGNYAIGVTRGFVETYLMKDGRPRYASSYVYNDQTTTDAVKDRDPRLTIFIKVPGQKNLFKNMNSSGGFAIDEPKPEIIKGGDNFYSTGYTLRKGGTFDKAIGLGSGCTNAAALFRATEALLNYMEAKYELTHNINDGHILEYWRTVREKAGFKGEAIDPSTTIQVTDMAKEDGDWGAYSCGEKLTDVVLYNIRRERRSELIAEGLRWMDLQRWRSLDQLMETSVHIEGMHLWNTPMQNWYNDENGKTKLAFDGDGSGRTPNVSSPKLSEYMRPHEVNMTNNSFVGGLTWHMAHYLQPLPIKQLILTASDHASPELSPLYQNPYWGTVAGEPAKK